MEKIKAIKEVRVARPELGLWSAKNLVERLFIPLVSEYANGVDWKIRHIAEFVGKKSAVNIYEHLTGFKVEARKVISSDANYEDIPVAVVNAFLNNPELTEYKYGRVNYYILKPYTIKNSAV